MEKFEQLGRHYAARMTAEQRSKAISTAQSTSKGMVSVVVGSKASTKALVMSASEFAAFKKGLA